LPNSYPTLPLPLAALYAGMLTKVGIYVIFRMLTTVLPHDLVFVHGLLAWMAGLTMLLGVLGAISRNYIRGILSFHILSQVGFMILAIGLFTPLSLAAAVVYIVHHIVVKSSLFLLGGIVLVLNRTDDLDRGANLWRVTPWVGVLFLAQAMSLAGLPPLSGFWGKYLILVAGLELKEYVLVGVSLVASVLTLFSMLKIWLGPFWREDESVVVWVNDPRWRPMAGVVTALTVISLLIGFGVEGVFRLAQQATATAMDQQGYALAVRQTLAEVNAKGLTP
jgi:multicomponent Na+:H+ antiporter subunit D